jgi:putative transposase
MDDHHRADLVRRRALLRFAVIGDLLAAPPPKGQLAAALEKLAAKTWTGLDGTPIRFARSTIEHWYYTARNATDPVRALTAAARSDRGTFKAINNVLLDALEEQYTRYPEWTAKLHADNLAALVRRHHPERIPPSYTTVRRTLRRKGWTRQRKVRTEGQRQALIRKGSREVRGFEMDHVHALWHLDFHHGSRRVVDADGRWHTPLLLAFVDDRARLVCHIQWYLSEDTERLVHGLTQAILKRGLPRAIMHDNGSAMRASEFLQGLENLGIASKPTLAYSPYQNGKQETFWTLVEGRLVAMLKRVDPLDLKTLNRVTQAWVEGGYHREKHEGINMSPLDCLDHSPCVARLSPTIDTLRFAFTQRTQRTQRRSDGTVSIEGVRFELPSRLRALTRVQVRYARWDLSQAWVVDPREGDVLARIVPVDRSANADARRKPHSFRIHEIAGHQLNHLGSHPCAVSG